MTDLPAIMEETGKCWSQHKNYGAFTSISTFVLRKMGDHSFRKFIQKIPVDSYHCLANIDSHLMFSTTDPTSKKKSNKSSSVDLKTLDDKWSQRFSRREVMCFTGTGSVQTTGCGHTEPASDDDYIGEH